MSTTTETKTAPTFRGDRLNTRRAEYVGKRHNGDGLAVAMVGMTPIQVVRYANYRLGLVATTAATTVEERIAHKGGLLDKYAHLNDGQKRMNAANLLRGAIRRGEVEEADVIRELGAIAKLNRCVMRGEKVVVSHVSTTDALRAMGRLVGRTVEELVEAGADLGNPGILADGTEVTIEYAEF